MICRRFDLVLLERQSCLLCLARKFVGISLNRAPTKEEVENSYFLIVILRKSANTGRIWPLFSKRSRMVNGHTPVKTNEGESPIREWWLAYFVIDGSSARPIKKKTGTAGYSLLNNSWLPVGDPSAFPKQLKKSLVLVCSNLPGN